MYAGNHLLRNSRTNQIESSKIYHFEHSHGLECLSEILQRDWREVFHPQSDYLILILRNYKESMLRHFDDNADQVLDHLRDDSSCVNQLRFFQHLRHFDNWPKERRLLIYYEDLMTKPKEEFSIFINFLGIPDTRLNSFINNLQQHQQNVIDLYNREHIKRHLPGIGSRSEGKDLLFHSKKVPNEILMQMDEIAKARAPDLYQKYLKRFETLLIDGVVE